MKAIYDFTVRAVTTQKEETAQEDGGVLIKDVTKERPVYVKVKKPNRSEKEEAEMIYSLHLSKCIKAGMLTKAQLTKQYSELGGVWSEQEVNEYQDLQERYARASDDFAQAQMKHANDPSEKNKNILAIEYQLTQNIHNQIKRFEEHKSEVFNETAEVKARNKVLAWYVTYLTYFTHSEEKDTEWTLLLEGDSFEDKLDLYDELLEDESEENEWKKNALEKAMLIITFWYSGRINTKEDLELIEDLIESDEFDMEEEELKEKKEELKGNSETKEKPSPPKKRAKKKEAAE